MEHDHIKLPSAIRGDSLATQVHNALRLAIRDGTVPPDQFFSEATFGESMGVSRTPVREALLALFKEGLVEIVPKRGFRLATLTESDVKEIQLLRIALEKLVVEQLCIHGTPTDFRELRSMIKEQATHTSNIFALDEAFHHHMAKLAGLPETGRLLLGVRGKMYLLAAGAKIPKARTDDVLREHARIVSMIEKRDIEGAHQMITDHVERSIAGFLRAKQADAKATA
jgi:DNA-binding GntR family transcriptional regulator